MPRRAAVHAAVLAAALWATPSAWAQPAAPAGAASATKVLRYAFRAAETGFDPASVSDLYSRIVISNIFEAPFQYAFLARPVALRPSTAIALSQSSDDFKTFTIRIRPGIFFTADPAFEGRPRELVAADYVYSLKRHVDPRWKSPHMSSIEEQQILGLSALRAEALTGKPFDYDREISGLRALDRYTLQLRLARGNPRLDDVLSDASVAGAVAREVVEAYGDRINEHPVGTGPFVLGRWKRSSQIVLERNPAFRDQFYDEQAPAGDVVAEAAVARLRGRKLPMIDRVEISIIEEAQPRWLAFLNGEMDLLEQVPEDFTTVALPNDRIAPNLARRGMYAVRYPRSDLALSYFAMDDPVVGGYTPAQVALRRAISLAVDTDKEIRQVRRGQAIVGHQFIGPGSTGFDPHLHSEMGEYSRARALALLDTYGYLDRDGDGWRERPDGSPLVIEHATQPDNLSRQLTLQWKKNMDAIGVRMVFRVAQWPENLKAARAGKLMMWGVGQSAGPDGGDFLRLGYGPSKGLSNLARFDLPEFNRLYDLQKTMPDGPERYAVMTRAEDLMTAYMPYKVHVHRIFTDIAQPWLIGFHRNVFLREFWKFVDIDVDRQAKRAP